MKPTTPRAPRRATRRRSQLDSPVRVAADQALTVTLSTEDGGPAVITGAVIATEGPWDDAVPTKVCALPGDMAWRDDLPPGMADLATCGGEERHGSKRAHTGRLAELQRTARQPLPLPLEERPPHVRGDMGSNGQRNKID